MDKFEWPSERVVHGGIFHQRNVNYSKETHEMMKSKVKSFFIGDNFLISFSSCPHAQNSFNERSETDDDAAQ